MRVSILLINSCFLTATAGPRHNFWQCQDWNHKDTTRFQNQGCQLIFWAIVHHVALFESGSIESIYPMKAMTVLQILSM